MDFSAPLHIGLMSDNVFHPIWSIVEHNDFQNELLFVLKGKLKLTYLDGRVFPAKAGQILINPAGTIHRDVFDADENLEVFLVHFSWPDANLFFEVVDNEKLNKISDSTKKQIDFLFDVVRTDCGSEDIDNVVADNILKTILLLIYRDVKTLSGTTGHHKRELQSRQRKLVVKAKKYIDKNFKAPIHLEDVAMELQVSPFYLSRLFSRNSDFSLVEYLTKVRLNEAEKLLLDGRYNVNDIAQMVGYENGNYFSKVFKKHFGISPSKFH
jgi:AraC-like DNA-binding protein